MNKLKPKNRLSVPLSTKSGHYNVQKKIKINSLICVQHNNETLYNYDTYTRKKWKQLLIKGVDDFTAMHNLSVSALYQIKVCE